MPVFETIFSAILNTTFGRLVASCLNRGEKQKAEKEQLVAAIRAMQDLTDELIKKADAKEPLHLDRGRFERTWDSVDKLLPETETTISKVGFQNALGSLSFGSRGFMDTLRTLRSFQTDLGNLARRVERQDWKGRGRR